MPMQYPLLLACLLLNVILQHSTTHIHATSNVQKNNLTEQQSIEVDVLTPPELMQTLQQQESYTLANHRNISTPSATDSTSSSPSSSSSWWSSSSSPFWFSCVSVLSVLSVGGGLWYLYHRYSLYRTRTATAQRISDFHKKPLLLFVGKGRGREQGTDWATHTLTRDEDGDEAHEFLGPFSFTDRANNNTQKTRRGKHIDNAALTNSIIHNHRHPDKANATAAADKTENGKEKHLNGHVGAVDDNESKVHSTHPSASPSVSTKNSQHPAKRKAKH